jgi:threonine synthase
MSRIGLQNNIFQQYNLEEQNIKRFDVNSVNFKIKSLWRYHQFIPVDFEGVITMGEGYTPLLQIDICESLVHIKQEQLFPTGSYKDRGATVLISDAHKKGITKLVQDSSGNAGCAIAAYAANAGIKCDIYVPADTSEAKLTQIRAYGASLILVDGDREVTADAALEAAKDTYYASHCYNPLFLHGTKTFAYEVCEQLGWQAPDVVVLPAGNGTLVLGCYLGFEHLLKSGVIDKMPRIIAVQAQSCAPLFKAWEQGLTEPEMVKSEYTLAEGIAIANPVRGKEMLKAVKATNGFFVAVTEDEIIAALKLCLSKGFYIEPTSAATIAGLIKTKENLNEKTWVTLFSGHGLKSTEKIMSLLKK